MKKLFFALLFLLPLLSMAQDADDLFNQIASESKNENPLLPERMVFTQRLLWGEKGLMRASDSFKLTEENRERELKIRRTMLTAHQVIGYVTLAGMVAQGIVGGKLYNGRSDLKDLHETIGGITTASYFTGATLSLFAPPPLINKKEKGFSSIKMHKTMAAIHFSAMIATNVLAESNKDAHKAAAYTLFTSYALAVISFKF